MRKQKENVLSELMSLRFGLPRRESPLHYCFANKIVPEKLRGEALQASGVDTSSAASLGLLMGVYDQKHWPRR